MIYNIEYIISVYRQFPIICPVQETLYFREMHDVFLRRSAPSAGSQIEALL